MDIICDKYGNLVYGGGLVDLNGNRIKKTPRTHPYSYDAHVIWRGGENEEITRCIYTDRLLQWDWDKHNMLCQKHFGDERQYWNDRDPEKIEKFLQDWTGREDLTLIVVMQMCNISSGYPVWSLHYNLPEHGE